MGIPHLYTHLRPYARPESFTSAGRTVPLYIDGPGLAHHIYQVSLCSTRLVASNPWESALAYAKFQDAVIRYLDLLMSASFSVCKIYFDGHLPAAKRPTRLSRLDESLRKLKLYHSQHPHSLRCSAKQREEPLDVFSETATYTPRTSYLSAPPFILAAMIEILSAHPTYCTTVSTVPGEAESYCARDAISTGGIVLTGDSDLLLFTSPSEMHWGVMMFRDVDITFPGPNVSAIVFRPTTMAKSLGLDLTFLGFLTQCDNHASFSVLQQRAVRIAERKKSGAVVEEYGKRWREFAGVYELPPICDSDAIIKGVEPRIAEIIQQRKGISGGDTKTMFLPFLWEDPTRGSAWDTSRSIRAIGYSLLFSASHRVEEVCRRGQRISDGLVEYIEDPCALLRSLSRSEDKKWWVHIVLEEIILVFENRNQKLPEKAILEGLAYMLSQTNTNVTASTSTPRKWTWERVQVFGMAQAAWYSLLLLKEIVSTTGILANEEDNIGECTSRFRTLPGVGECIDGNRFIDGLTMSSEMEKSLVKTVMEAHYIRLRTAELDEKEEDSTAIEDIELGSGNNRKRSSNLEQRNEIGVLKKKRKKKNGAQGGGESGGKVVGKKKGERVLDTGNTFSVLASKV